MADTPSLAVTIRDVAGAQVVVGKGNLAIQLTLDGSSGYSDRSVSAPLQVRALPVLRVRDGVEDPVGRTALIDQAVADLSRGRSVQVCGATGVGKAAVAEAVARRLGSDRKVGALVTGGQARHTVDSLYFSLIRLFFDVKWYEPDEAVLRAETARHRPSGVIVVPDCELPAEDAERLLGTFPDCTFLLTSNQQSLYTGATVLDLDPLNLEEAGQLVERRLGRALEASETMQVQRAHELSQGRVARLLVCAAFLERATADARQTTVVPLPAEQQVDLLIAGVGEPARQALAALAAFGPAREELFGYLTGLQPGPGTAAELEHAGLVTRLDDHYEVAEDATRILTTRGWVADPRIAADGIQGLLTSKGSDTLPSPDPALCLEIARALDAADDRERASSFIRVAAPAAMAAGELGVWARLVALGVRCATDSGRGRDLAYFLNEQHTGALLRGDRVAAALALAAMADLLGSPGAIAPPPAQPAAPKQPGRRSLRRTRHALNAKVGAVAGTAVLTAAALVATGAVAGAAAVTTAAVIGTHSSSHNGTGSGTSGPGTGSGTSTTADSVSMVTHSEYKIQGGQSPFELSVQYPVISGLADKAVEDRINAELRAPIDQAVSGYKPQPGQPIANPPASGPVPLDPSTLTTVETIFRTGQVISVLYITWNHFSGGADQSYGLQTLTIRTDTGAIIANGDLLTSAAHTPAGISTLTADLQAQAGVSDCDSTWSGESSLATEVQGLTTPGATLDANVSAAGLVVSFDDDSISGTACQPVGVLPWSELSGLVNPTVAALAGASTTGPTPSQSATTAPITPTAPTAPPTSALPSPGSPAAAVESYIAAINSGNYQQAWQLGGDNLGGTYAAFVSGFNGTKQDTITIESTLGDVVSVQLVATMSDGTQNTFTGTYTVDGGVITAAHLQ